MRMVNRVHSNTTNMWPNMTLGFVFPIRTASFQHRLVNSTTTSHKTNHGTALRQDGLLGSRWKTNTSRSIIFVMRNDRDVVARSSSQLATITRLLFQIAHNSTWSRTTREQPDQDKKATKRGRSRTERTTGRREQTQYHSLPRKPKQITSERNQNTTLSARESTTKQEESEQRKRR